MQRRFPIVDILFRSGDIRDRNAKSSEIAPKKSMFFDPVICLREEAIFVKSQKCPYHVTFDLDLDLEHILDVGVCGYHRVRVKVYSQTDRQTDRRTTDASRLHKLIPME